MYAPSGSQIHEARAVEGQHVEYGDCDLEGRDKCREREFVHTEDCLIEERDGYAHEGIS